MPKILHSHRTYCILAAALTLPATVCRVLSVILYTDPTSGYFRAGAALPVLTHVLMALAAVCLLLYPLFLLRGHVPTARTAHSPAITAGALLCALLFFLNFINTCLFGSTLPGPLLALTLLALLCGTLYFLLLTPKFKVSRKTLAVLGSFAVGAMACLVALTYFDIATPMNAPHKTELHLALLACMLYLLYELRDVAQIPMPRMLAACSALAFFLSVTVGLSNLAAYAFGVYRSPLYLAEDLLLPALAVYIAARSGADIVNAPAITDKEESTV